MNKRIIIPLVSAAFLLTACGPDFGKTITRNEFNDKAKNVLDVNLEDIQKVESKGSATATGQEKVSFDKTITDFKKAFEDEDDIAMLIYTYSDIDFVVDLYKDYTKFDDDKQEFFYNEANKTIGFKHSINGSATVNNVFTKINLNSEYIWNEYGLPTHIKEELSLEVNGQGVNINQKVNINADITYTIATPNA